MFKIKNGLLSSVVCYAPDDEKGVDTRTPAQKERDAIEVVTSKKTDTGDDTKTDDKTDDDAGDKDEGDEGEDGDDETKDEDAGDDDKEEPKELTAEQKEIEKLKKSIERLTKRVGKTTAEKAEIASQLKQTKASLEAKVADGEGLTEEEVNRRATELAQNMTATQEFENAKAKLAKAAVKADPEFMTKVQELAQDVGPIPSHMIGILEDLDNENGGAVLAYFANNPDEFEEIHTASLTKMSNRINKISDKLVEDAKPKKKVISKAPAPLDTTKGGSKSPSVLTGKEDMDTFVKMRAEQSEAYRKKKLGIA